MYSLMTLNLTQPAKSLIEDTYFLYNRILRCEVVSKYRFATFNINEPYNGIN